jgi:hypothetical protein
MLFKTWIKHSGQYPPSKHPKHKGRQQSIYRKSNRASADPWYR